MRLILWCKQQVSLGRQCRNCWPKYSSTHQSFPSLGPTVGQSKQVSKDEGRFLVPWAVHAEVLGQLASISMHMILRSREEEWSRRQILHGKELWTHTWCRADVTTRSCRSWAHVHQQQSFSYQPQAYFDCFIEPESSWSDGGQPGQKLSTLLLFAHY